MSVSAAVVDADVDAADAADAEGVAVSHDAGCMRLDDHGHVAAIETLVKESVAHL